MKAAAGKTMVGTRGEVLLFVLQMTVSLLIAVGFTILACGLLARRGSHAATKSRFKGGQKAVAAVVLVVLSLLVLLNPELVTLGFLGDAAFVDLLVVLIGVRFQAVGAQARTWLVAISSPFVRWFKSPRMVYLGVLFCIAFENVISEVRDIFQRISS
jgi:hypothetical protein